MKRLLSLLLIVASVSLADVELPLILPQQGPILTTTAIVDVYDYSSEAFKKVPLEFLSLILVLRRLSVLIAI